MSYHHFTPSERNVLANLRRLKWTVRAIARALGRSPSTISREVRRNSEREGYNPHWANLQYWKRREQKQLRYKTGDSSLMERVIDKMKEGWSPEQIWGRFKHVDFPEQPAMWISHESVYRYVWEDKKNGGNLYQYLRRGRKKYGKRGAGPHPNRKIAGRVSIDERAPIVAEQGRFGDWEADTIYGRHRESCMVTVIERKSLFCTVAHILDTTIASVNQGILQSFLLIPKQIVLTITVDNGKEWAGFKSLEKALDAMVYFTHPYSAWERPVNENLNGLLRQYLPKKSDLRCTTEEQLAQIVKTMNDRPRKKHKYRTPSEIFSEACVALAT